MPRMSAPGPSPRDDSSVPCCELEVPGVLLRDGLALHLDWVSEEEEASLLASLDSLPWDTTIKRRTQHFGYRFDYATKGNGSIMPLPEFVEALVRRCSVAVDGAGAPLLPWAQQGWELNRAQVTVNEYVPGTAIATHVDTHAAFDDGIASLSLGAGIAFRLQLPEQGHDISLWLPRRSLLVLRGAARYRWQHAISGRKYDRVAGEWVARARRVSFTLRHMTRDGQCHCAWPEACDARPGGAHLKPLPTRLTSTR